MGQELIVINALAIILFGGWFLFKRAVKKTEERLESRTDELGLPIPRWPGPPPGMRPPAATPKPRVEPINPWPHPEPRWNTHLEAQYRPGHMEIPGPTFMGYPILNGNIVFPDGLSASRAHHVLEVWERFHREGLTMAPAVPMVFPKTDHFPIQENEPKQENKERTLEL